MPTYRYHFKHKNCGEDVELPETHIADPYTWKNVRCPIHGPIGEFDIDVVKADPHIVETPTPPAPES